MNFAVLIPAFNEVSTIRDVVQRCLRHTNNVIVVDDGSGDGTVEQVADLPVSIFRHEINQGKAASLWEGFQAAVKMQVDGVITLDGDGQHAPEEIPKLLAIAQNRSDHLIVGSRLWDKRAFPPARYRANRFANFWIAWASGQPIEDSQSGFRYYPAALLRKLLSRGHHAPGFVFESEVIIDAARIGHPCTPVRISAIYDAGARPSHFHPFLDIARIVLMVAGKLISCRLCPSGLARSMKRQP